MTQHTITRQESFPGWHRAYLCEFERAFQQADYDLNGAAIEAGTLNHLGWPYWDPITRTQVSKQGSEGSN